MYRYWTVCLGNYTEAFADINRAIKLNSNDAEVYYERADIYKTITKYKLKKDNICKKIEIVNNEFKFILNGKLQNANITDFEITAKGTKPIISDFEISKILK